MSEKSVKIYTNKENLAKRILKDGGYDFTIDRSYFPINYNKLLGMIDVLIKTSNNLTSIPKTSIFKEFRMFSNNEPRFFEINIFPINGKEVSLSELSNDIGIMTYSSKDDMDDLSEILGDSDELITILDELVNDINIIKNNLFFL